MINLILLTISLVVFGGYVEIIWSKYGIQKSISMSYYCLPDKFKFVFTLILFGFSIPIILVSSDMVFMPIAGWLISGVGAACNIMSNKITKTVHMISAIGGITLAFFSLCYEYNAWIIVVISAILMGIAAFKIKEGKIWWIEIIAFTAVWIGLLLNNI